VRSVTAEEKQVYAKVFLNGKASVTDAKLLTLMKTWDLALLENCLSQRGIGACWGHLQPLLRSDWVAA
jgi:hypothetical protein